MAAEEDYSSDIVRLSFMDETLSHAGAEFSGEEEEGMDGMSLRLSAEQGDQPLLLFFNVPLHGHVNPTLDLGNFSFFFFPFFVFFSFLSFFSSFLLRDWLCQSNMF